MFKNRTIGFWIGLGSSILMLVANILFIVFDYSDRTFSWITFSLIMLGVCCEIVSIIITNNYFPMLPSVFYGVALSFHLYLGFPTLSDVINGVNFIGGNPTAVIVFGALFFLGTACSIVSSFMTQTKLE